MSRSKTVTVKASVKLPNLPNFLIISETPEGASAPGTIDVADITDEALRQLGKEWTEALVEHARLRRERSA